MLNLVKQDLTHGRFLIWRSGLKILSDHFFLGVGLGLFNMVYSKYRPASFTRFVNYAHSDYIQISSDMGIIGLGVYLILIITLLLKGLKALKLTNQYNRVIVIGVITALFGAIIRSLWDSNLFMLQSLSIYFFLLMGILIKSTEDKKNATYK